MQSKFFALLAVGAGFMLAGSASAFTVVVENDNGNSVTVYAPPTGVGLDVDKEFLNIQSITLRLTVTADDKAAGLVEISEGLLNESGQDWLDFHMELQGVTGATPVFSASAGNPWEDYAGNGPIANTTTVNGNKIDILWNVANGEAVYTGYFNSTEGRLFIDVSNLNEGDEFFLIETPSVVPEPATMAGLAGAFAFFARRRRSK